MPVSTAPSSHLPVLYMTPFPRVTPPFLRRRYPAFVDALRDLDDPLTMTHLFATLPAESNHDIPAKVVANAKRLSMEFQAYVVRAHALRKVFVSVKGFYYQADIQGQAVTWLVPHNLAQASVLLLHRCSFLQPCCTAIWMSVECRVCCLASCAVDSCHICSRGARVITSVTSRLHSRPHAQTACSDCMLRLLLECRTCSASPQALLVAHHC